MEEKEKMISESEHQDLLVLYQVTAQDQAFFKSQQWTLTNYALVAFAAIVGIPQLAGVILTRCSQLALSIGAILIAISAMWVIYRLKQSIEERRKRLGRIYVKLSNEFRMARGNKPKVSANEMLIFLYVLIFLGLVIALWLLNTMGGGCA
jgi:hypothetical protein